MGLDLKTLPALTLTGSAQALSTSLAAVKIFLTAPAANAAVLYIGDSSVALGRGIEIAKGTTFTISDENGGFLDLATTYVIGTAADKLSVSYLVKR